MSLVLHRNFRNPTDKGIGIRNDLLLGVQSTENHTFNDLGYIVPVLPNQPFFWGAGVRQNWIAGPDTFPGSWTVQAECTITALPGGGPGSELETLYPGAPRDAHKAVITSSSKGFFQAAIHPWSHTAGAWRYAGWFRTDNLAAEPVSTIRITDPNSSGNGATLTLTSEWQYFEGYVENAGSTGSGFWVQRASTNTLQDFEFAGLEWEPVNGKHTHENLFLATEDFTSGNWTESGIEILTAADQNLVAPDGTTTGWTLTDNGDLVSGSINVYQNTNAEESTCGWYHRVVYLKNIANSPWCRLYESNHGATSLSTYVNLSTGAIGTDTHYNTQTALLDNGWVKIEYDFPITSAAGVYTCWFTMAENDGDAIITRDGTHQMGIWHPQLAAMNPSGIVSKYMEGGTSSDNEHYYGGHVAYDFGDYRRALNYPDLPVERDDVKQRWFGGAEGLVIQNNLASDTDWSSDLNNAAWTKTNADCTGKCHSIFGTFPGASYAYGRLLKDDGLTGTGNVKVAQSHTIATSQQHTAWGIVAADQLSWCKLAFENNGALVIHQYFDLANTATGTPGANVTDSGIQDLGAGHKLIWMRFTSDAVDTTGDLALYVADANLDDVVDRDGTSSIAVSLLVLDQVDQPWVGRPTAASGQATNRPTSSSHQAGHTQLNAEEGAMLVDYNFEFGLRAPGDIFAARGATNDYVAHYVSATAGDTVVPNRIAADGVTTMNSAGAASALGTPTRSVVTWGGGSGTSQVNSETQVNDASVTSPDTTGTAFEYIGFGVSLVYGNVAEVIVGEVGMWDNKMTDNDVAGVASGSLNINQVTLQEDDDELRNRKLARLRYRRR